MKSLPPMKFIKTDSVLYDAKIIQRLFEYRIIDENGCWIWQKHLNADGYGTLVYKERDELAHILAFVLIGGEKIIYGMVLDHFVCDNPSCINPDHLKQTTPKKNILRGTNPAAINARKLVCNRGHPLEGDNVIKEKGDKRACKICRHRKRITKNEVCHS